MTDKETIDFNVTAAGIIRMSVQAHVLTGNSVGFSFGVSWGRHEFAGGVLSRSEALRMAKHIISECEKCTTTEDEEVKMRYKNMDTVKFL